MKSYHILVLLCLLILSCAPQATPTPTALPTDTTPPTPTAMATATEAPTSISTPTETPAPASTAVLVDPPSQSVDLGELVSVDIQLDAVTNLYAVDIRLSFDAAKLEVQDANTGAAGVQVEPGSFLDPAQGFVAENSADNTAGAVRYVFTLKAPAPAASGGGVLAHITFKAKAVGTAAVTLTRVDLVDDQVQPIAAALMDGSITVVAPGEPITYVVQPGDSLANIALRFDVPVAAIVLLNGMSYPWSVYAGQVLIIPVNLAPAQTRTPMPAIAPTPVQPVTP